MQFSLESWTVSTFGMPKKEEMRCAAGEVWFMVSRRLPVV
jgi:hypothetical protein